MDTQPTVWTEQFLYDGGGLRLVRTDEENSITTFYVRDASGQVLSEFIRPAGSSDHPVWSQDTYYGLGGALGVVEATQPDPPAGLIPSVSCVGDPKVCDVDLSWSSPASSTVDFYRVYRKLITDPTYDEALGTTTTTSYTDVGVAAGYYNYVVRGVVVDPLLPPEDPSYETEGADSREVTIHAGLGPPPSVFNLQAEVLEGSVRLTWNRASIDIPFIQTDFFDYKVERRPLSEPPYPPWETLTTRPLREPYFVDPDPPRGVYSQYQVSVVDTSGNEAPAAILVDGPPIDVFAPTAPAGVLGSAGPGPQEATIAWDPSTESDVLSYSVWVLEGTGWVDAASSENYTVDYSDGSDWIFTDTTIPATSSRVRFRDLPERVPITVAIKAHDASNASPRSAATTVRPALKNSSLMTPDLFGATRNPDSADFLVSYENDFGRLYRRLAGC